MRSAVMGTYMLLFEFLVPHINIFFNSAGMFTKISKDFYWFRLDMHMSVQFDIHVSIYLYIYYSLCLHCESVTFNVKSDYVYEHKWTSPCVLNWYIIARVNKTFKLTKPIRYVLLRKNRLIISIYTIPKESFVSNLFLSTCPLHGIVVPSIFHFHNKERI